MEMEKPGADVPADEPQPVILDLPLPRGWIDQNAAKVVRRLYSHDHQVYLVGGCVRDLLVGRYPKDFDIATSAMPREVKRTFSNCRLIGRRFRLAHILFRDTIVEVATFRRDPNAEDDEETSAEDQGDGGDLLIRDDNVFGTAADDAFRRDFTINALYYDLIQNQVIDYVGGLKDIELRVVRTIGEPRRRFQEDPIRMLRAIKFASALGFSIEEETWRAMVEVSSDLSRAAVPRVQEELFKMLRGGFSQRCFELLDAAGLLRQMLPDHTRYLGSGHMTFSEGTLAAPRVSHVQLEDEPDRSGRVSAQESKEGEQDDGATGFDAQSHADDTDDGGEDLHEDRAGELDNDGFEDRSDDLDNEPDGRDDEPDGRDDESEIAYDEDGRPLFDDRSDDDAGSGPARHAERHPNDHLAPLRAYLDAFDHMVEPLENHLYLAILSLHPSSDQVSLDKRMALQEQLTRQSAHWLANTGTDLRLPRRDRERARLAMMGFSRMLLRRDRHRLATSLSRKSYFTEATAVFGLHCLATGEEIDVFWNLIDRVGMTPELQPIASAIERRHGPKPPSRPQDRTRPRRDGEPKPRRRRRRRRRAES